MKIFIVYALPDRQVVRDLELPEGTTVAVALRGSGFLEEFPAIDPTNTPLGIYGRIVSGDTVLQPGERLEIYRPLHVEPKTARRQRSNRH
jgi:putative ubiquitin-RnfH superfamily antitoxin RatB of RatAB toxin-antitoxin module